LRSNKSEFIQKAGWKRRWQTVVQNLSCHEADLLAVYLLTTGWRVPSPNWMFAAKWCTSDPNCLVGRCFAALQILRTKVIISSGYSSNWSVCPFGVPDILHNGQAGGSNCLEAIFAIHQTHGKGKKTHLIVVEDKVQVRLNKELGTRSGSLNACLQSLMWLMPR
jgi:hypothetical protein